MKILFLSQQYPPETGWGGIGSYVFAMAHALTERGHEVHVLSCVPGQQERDYLDGKVRMHRRGIRRIKGLGRVIRNWDVRARIETAATCWLDYRRLGQRFDVVEAPDWYAEALGFATLRSEALVVHLHGGTLIVAKYGGFMAGGSMSVGDRAANWLERFCANRAHALTSPSQIMVDELVEANWLTDRKVRIIRNPIDLHNWDSIPPPLATRPLILAVGTLDANKAPELLVRAVALLAHDIPAIEVVFIGRSSGLREGRSYKEWVEQLSLELRAPCRFIEHVARDQLAGWFRQARVVAVASMFDNFPMAALEGMAACRPVVCTDRVGTKEIMDADAGAVVPCNDPVALADALRPYLMNVSRAVAAGNRARALVKIHCSPDTVARERESCYQEAIETK